MDRRCVATLEVYIIGNVVTMCYVFNFFPCSLHIHISFSRSFSLFLSQKRRCLKALSMVDVSGTRMQSTGGVQVFGVLPLYRSSPSQGIADKPGILHFIKTFDCLLIIQLFFLLP